MLYHRNIDITQNSLIPRNMLERSMIRQNYPVVIPARADSNDLGIGRCVYVNWNGAATGRGQLLPAFVMPSGVTSGTMELGARVRSVAGTNADHINMAIYNDLINTRLVEKDRTLTTQMVWDQMRVTGLVPGSNYFAAIECNHLSGNQCKPELMDLSFQPDLSTDSTSLWSRAERVKRYSFWPGMAGDNAYTAHVILYDRQSTELNWSFWTNADRVAVEAYVQNSTNPARVYCLCNGEAVGRADMASLKVSIAEFDIPRRQQYNLVTFRSSLHSVSGGANPLGLFLRAAYFPTSAEVRAPPGVVTPRRISWVCDSISLGMIADSWETQGTVAIVRDFFPGGADHVQLVGAQSGLKLYDIAKDTATIQATAREFARSMPTDIVIDLGVNDVLVSPATTWSQTEFQAQYDALVTELHARCPNAHIYAVSPTRRNAADTPNSYGLTLAQVRAAIPAVQALHTPWMTAKAGDDTDMPTTAPINLIAPDNTHLIQDGHGVKAMALCTTLGI